MKPTSKNADEVFRRAVAKHRNGSLAEAEILYRKVLSISPGHADSLNLLGLIACQAGQFAVAVDWFRQAIAKDGTSAVYFANLGNALQDLGRLDEAVVSFSNALRRRPDFAEAYYNLGNAIKTLGQAAAAVVAYRGALVLRPNYPQALNNTGVVLKDLDRMADAAIVCRQAFRLVPDGIDTVSNLGLALDGIKQLTAAVDIFRWGLVQHPGSAELQNNLGKSLNNLNRFEEALVHFRRALSQQADYPECRYNCGIAFRGLGRLTDALAAYHGALGLRPAYADAFNNLGMTLKELEQISKALTQYRRAVEIEPSRSLFHTNAAHALFCLGRWAEAWQAYELRPLPPRALPRWNGTPQLDKTLLIWKEQGIADQILVLGMIPDVARVMGAVLVECDPRLVSLVARSFPEITVLPAMEPPHPLSDAADLQVPMFSLGQFFRNAPVDYPHHKGYLRPDPARVEYWKAWLGTLGPGPKIGISWRSFDPAYRPFFLPTLEQLLPLFRIAGVSFVNLQYGKAEDEISDFFRRTGVRIHIADGLDVTDDIDDVAALIRALDAVTGFSSAASILAGAVGTPLMMYVYYPGENENRMLGMDYMPWLPDAKIAHYGFEKNLDLLVHDFAKKLECFVAAVEDGGFSGSTELGCGESR